MFDRIDLEDYFHSSVTAYCHKDRSFLSSIRTIIEIILKDIHSPFLTLDELINNYKHGEALDNKLDNIRRIANEYIHGHSVDVRFDKYDFDIYFKPINDLIDYAQRFNNISYSIRYERDKMIIFEVAENEYLSDQIPISLMKDFGKGHNRYNNHTLKTFFKEDFEEAEPLCGKDYVLISGGFFSSDKCIKFRKPRIAKNVKEENVVYKALYNLLLRNNVIPIPNNLKAKGLSFDSLNRIYAMECLITYAASALNKTRIIIFASTKDIEILNYAIADIHEMYQKYWLLLERQVDAKEYAEPQVIAEEDEDLDDFNFRIRINNDEYDIEEVAITEFVSNLYLIAIKNFNLHFDSNNSDVWDYFANLIFGYEGLKVGQQNILEHSLYASTFGEVPCCILPTGYGKSALYQLTAFLTPKISFVISPTLILIRDQLNNLRDVIGNKMAKVLPNRINTDSLETTALLYYSDANSLYNKENIKVFEKLFIQSYLGFFNIDECHQISIWSQNFDFNYLTLTDFIVSNMPRVKVVLYTATANDNVQNDLMIRFKNVPKGKPERNVKFIIAGSFKRDLIEHKKFAVKDNDELLEIFRQQLLLELERAKKDVKDHKIAFENIVVINNDVELLKKAYDYVKDIPYVDGSKTIGDTSVFYSSREQDAYSLFVNGLRNVMFASDEFSIGINIPSVKTIITLGTPPSKEWYYQETGRVCRLSTMGLTKDDKQVIMGHAVEIYIDDKKYQEPMTMTSIDKLIDWPNALYSNLCLTLDTFTQFDLDTKLMQNILMHGNKVSKPYYFDSDLQKSYKFSTGVYLSLVSGVIVKYNGSVLDDNKSIRYSVIYDLKHDSPDFVRSSMLKFAESYQTSIDVTKKFSDETKFFSSVNKLIDPFVKWYYSSLLYQVYQSFINSQSMLNDYSDSDIENMLEVTFTAKLAGKKAKNFILVGVELGPLDDLKRALNEYEDSKEDLTILFERYVQLAKKKLKNLTDMEIIAVLQDSIALKDIPIFSWLLGFYEIKNNNDPVRFSNSKHSMSKLEFEKYINVIIDNIDLSTQLKEEYIMSLIQVVSIDKLYKKNILNENTNIDIINKLKMIEAIKLFGMGE